MGSLYLLLIFLIPIWGVNEAPLGIRITLSVFAFLFAVSLLAIFQTEALTGRPAEPTDDIKTASPLFKHGFAWIWLVAVSGASAATHGDPDMPVFGWLITNVSRVGETLIPLVAKYRSQMGMPAPELFRLQGVMSFMLLASFATVLLFIGVVLQVRGQRGLPKGSLRRQMAELDDEKGGFGTYAGALMFLGFGVNTYFAWMDFPTIASGIKKSCLFEALCYALYGDFGLFAVALFKVVMILFMAASIFLILFKLLKVWNLQSSSPR